MDSYGNDDPRDVFGNSPSDSFGNPTNLNSFGNQPADVWGNTLGAADHSHHDHGLDDHASHDPNAPHNHDQVGGMLEGLWTFFTGDHDHHG